MSAGGFIAVEYLTRNGFMCCKNHTDNGVFGAACWLRVLYAKDLVCLHRYRLLWWAFYIFIFFIYYLNRIKVLTWTEKGWQYYTLKRWLYSECWWEYIHSTWLAGENRTIKTLTVEVILVRNICEFCKTDVFGNLPFVAEFALAFLALQTSVHFSVLWFIWRFWQHIRYLFLWLTGQFVRHLDICLGFLSGSLWSTSFSFDSLYNNIKLV